MKKWSTLILIAVFTVGFVLSGKGILGGVVGTVLAMIAYIIICSIDEDNNDQ